MTARWIDWIWHVRGTLPLAPGQSGDEAFDRLDPLFRQDGTSHERSHDTLVFRKKDPAAQDRMSVFDSGTLTIRPGVAGTVLQYNLVSRTLLFCFLAPLLFLAFAQATKVIVSLQKHRSEAAAAAAKAAGKDQKAAKKPDKAAKPAPLNPIDKFLGAPAPEAKKDKAEGDAGGEDGPKKPSPTPAYVFAVIFVTLYVIGRILEDRLIVSLFRKRLFDR